MDGEVLFGQLYDTSTGAVTPFTEQMQNCERGGQVVAIGQSNTEVIPNDANSSKVKVFALAATQMYLDAYLTEKGFYAQLRMPDELVNVFVTFNASGGIGNDNVTGDGSAYGPSPSLSLGFSAKATSSATIIPDVTWDIKQSWATNVPASLVEVYMPESFTIDELITHIKELKGIVSLLTWPHFRPVTHIISAKGQQASLSANASVQQSISLGTNSSAVYSTGTGHSIDSGGTTKTIIIPPTIHPEIVLDINSQMTSIDVVASAGWANNPGGNWPGRSAVSNPDAITVIATVTPTVLPATSPEAIPTSGLYLYDFAVGQPNYGRIRVQAQLIDMAYFA